MLRFLALGDSYTIGESAAEADRWPVRLAALLREKGFIVEEPEIIAKTGWTTDELDAAIDAASPQGTYELVSLQIGVNNQYRQRSLEEYRAQFGALLARAAGFASDRSSRVIVLSIPDWGVTPYARAKDRDAATIRAEIDAFNDVNRAATGLAGARYVDITPISRLAASDRGQLAPDGLHPSAAAYALWAKLALDDAVAALSGE